MRRRWAVRWGDTSVGPRQRKQSMPLGTIESSLSGISEARCVILVSDGVSCCAVVDFALLRAVRVASSATELLLPRRPGCISLGSDHCSIVRRSPAAGLALSHSEAFSCSRSHDGLSIYRSSTCQSNHQGLHHRHADLVCLPPIWGGIVYAVRARNIHRCQTRATRGMESSRAGPRLLISDDRVPCSSGCAFPILRSFMMH